MPPKRWAAIRLFAMDVDGVLTDGTIAIHSAGGESKSFSVLDGMGLKRLERAGIVVAWISGRFSGATEKRATELGILHVVQGRTDKLSVLQELAHQLEIPPQHVCYMGDDDIDAPAIAWSGVGVAPATAMPAALKAADYIANRAAGQGAVREVCEHILVGRGHSAA
jgi:3-deoxy-D-manno-octulosonate 8-phosphate phosphatase (KDO 8-P phosphatase)